MEAPAISPSTPDSSPDPLPESSAEYTYRATMLDDEQRFRLEGGVLSVFTERQGEWRIPLAAVRNVHLRYERTKIRSYYTCDITLSDKSRVKFGNMHFAGLANFQDRAASYTPFVLALHEALVPHRDRATFRVGSLANFIMATIGTFFFLAIAAVAAMIGRWWYALMGVLALTWIVPNLTRSRPRRYKPEQVPVKFLPGWR